MEQLPTPHNNFFQFALSHLPNARSLSLTELVRSPSGLGDYQVDFRFPLLDLSQLSDDEIAGEPVLRNTLRLLKYSRSKHLVSKLGEIIQLIAQSLPEGRLLQWIEAIGVYVMSVNKDMDSQQYKQTLKSVFPTQFEPGSLADRLLIQGREEGKLAGKIQTLQELLGDVVSTDDELLSRDRETLTTELTGLQARLRHER